MRFLVFLLPVVATIAAQPCYADAKALDFWDEEVRLFGVAAAAGSIADSLDKRIAPNYRADFLSLNPGDKRVGDFSLAYAPSKARNSEQFGFVSSLWGESWTLDSRMTLRFWAKVDGAGAGGRWKVTLSDSAGRTATGDVRVINRDWTEVSVSLAKLTADQNFAWSDVRTLSFSADFSGRPTVLLDGVRFVSANSTIGVTDKTLAQRKAEAARTRDIRIAKAFLDQAAAMKGDDSGQLSSNEAEAYADLTAFAKFMVAEDLANANAMLITQLEKSSLKDVWNLARTPLLARLYFMFSNSHGRYPGRMTEEAEALLLQALWDRTVAKNDIALTRQSTWWMEGSENHDLNMKASNLVVSRIFMNEPAYKDRILPNYGYAGAYHYGHAGYYGPGVDLKAKRGGGRADLSDGQKYTASDNYRAWVDYFKRYFRERGERGFFLEYGSSTYSKHSMGFVDLVRQFSGDDELRELASDFVTVFWADWAQTSISGIRGGPKTRHPNTVGGAIDKGTADLISFHMGGPGNAGLWWYWNLIGDYELPDVVWKMALDRESMGSFTYKSRGIGEEQNIWPRPLGTERAMIVDTESRFLKSTHVTPHYTIGTQMDHPAAVHSHLSVKDRWHGLTTAQSKDARLVVVGIPEVPDAPGARMREYDTQVMMNTAHAGRTLVMQQYRRWYTAHPTWFPAERYRYDRQIGVWFGSDWDERQEKLGWVFVRKGKALAAVRPVTWDEPYERARNTGGEGNQRFFNKPYDEPTVKLLDRAYEWNESGTIMKLTDPFAVTIMEAASTDDYKSLAAFMDDVLDNPIALHKTVVPGFHIFVYTGSSPGGDEIVLNAGAPDIPTIGGEGVDYSYDMLFDSPFMRSEYKSGVVTLSHTGDQTIIDFRR